MKKNSPRRPARQAARSKKPTAEVESAAARQLGGQPENDADARAAGLESATAAAPKPAKPRTAPKAP